MNNTNTAGTYTSGETFRVLVNANGTTVPNLVDTADIFPLMQPTVPAPGLQWNLTAIEPYGLVGITNSTMVWDGQGNLSWDTNSSAGNWKNSQLYGDNQGAIFDDSATGSTTINLATSVAPAGFNIVNITNTDHSTFTNIVQMSNAPAYMPGIVVSNALKNYTIAGIGKITGQTSIYKTGPGTLTLLTTNNDFSGGMVIEGGTVAVTNTLALGFSGTFIGQKPAYNQIMIDNGTLKFFGTTNQSLGWFLTLNADGGTIEVSSNTTVLTENDSIVGAGGLTKTGAGVLTLINAADNYASGTMVNQGTLRLTTAAAGTGSITLNNGTTLDVTNTSGTVTLTNVMNISGASTTIRELGTGTNVFGGQWIGSGTATFNTTNVLDLVVFNTGLSNFAGTISCGTSVSTFRFNNRTNDNPCKGSTSAAFDLGTGSANLLNYNGAGLTYDLGSLAGGPNTTLSGRYTNNTFVAAATTYSIGANGLSTTFAGQITNGLDTVSVVKVGAGTLLLNGVSTYTGSTTVSNGILGGTGSIASPLTVAAGGTLSPGAPLGTFTVNNSVTLGGTVLMELNTANLPNNSDRLVVTGTLTGGGALTVTNVGPDIYNGTKFTLFNKAVTGFTSLVLPTNNAAHTRTYVWINNLATDGSITMSGGNPNPNPTNIVATVASGVLTLTWPTDHTGWLLQVQTNPLSTGLSNNWFALPSSTNGNTESFPMDVTQGSIFYRLVLP
jgi:autotransporter-associated beta strand protein